MDDDLKAPEIEYAGIVVREGVFRLDGTGVNVRFRIYEGPIATPDRYWFELSHWIKTPTQLGPYTPSRPYCDSIDSAEHRAVFTTIVEYHRQAVDAGHTPDDSWLVPNPDW